jgi:hypothetical protein
MKSFKVREGKVLVEGVYYSDAPSSNEIKGKLGKIHSINIAGKQFFPYGGEFIDDTLPTTSDNTGIVEETKPTKKLKKTELVESSSPATDTNGKPIKKKTTKKG